MARSTRASRRNLPAAGEPVWRRAATSRLFRAGGRSGIEGLSTSTEGSCAAMSTAAATAPVWNLSDLYDSIEDPRIAADVSAARERAQALEAAYTGRIAAAELTTDTLRAALDEYEAILRLQDRPMAYASLRFSADTADPA